MSTPGSILKSAEEVAHHRLNLLLHDLMDNSLDKLSQPVNLPLHQHLANPLFTLRSLPGHPAVLFAALAGGVLHRQDGLFLFALNGYALDSTDHYMLW
jgi:hypothetical protein